MLKKKNFIGISQAQGGTGNSLSKNRNKLVTNCIPVYETQRTYKIHKRNFINTLVTIRCPPYCWCQQWSGTRIDPRLIAGHPSAGGCRSHSPCRTSTQSVSHMKASRPRRYRIQAVLKKRCRMGKFGYLENCMSSSTYKDIIIFFASKEGSALSNNETYTVKRVDEVVRHLHLVTQDQFTQILKKVSDIPKENFTINIELFRHFSQVSN